MIDVEDDLSRFLAGDFCIFLCMYFIQHCFICRSSDFHCVGGCWDNTPDNYNFGNDCQTVYSATSHPHSASSHPRSATSHPLSATSHTRLHFIHNSATSHPHSATSHPQLGYISSTLGFISRSATSHPLSSISRFLILIFILSSENKGRPCVVLNTHFPSMLWSYIEYR